MQIWRSLSSLYFCKSFVLKDVSYKLNSFKSCCKNKSCMFTFQRLQVDLERSASISRSLGSRVAQCSINGLADFLYRYVYYTVNPFTPGHRRRYTCDLPLHAVNSWLSALITVCLVIVTGGPDRQDTFSVKGLKQMYPTKKQRWVSSDSGCACAHCASIVGGVSSMKARELQLWSWEQRMKWLHQRWP